jgi:hypothetical protein
MEVSPIKMYLLLEREFLCIEYISLLLMFS